MKDLNSLADKCIRLLNNIGINCGRVNFTINTRAKKRWGQCAAKGDNSFEISISHILLQDNIDDIAAENTIIHELLHAADSCKNGHRGRWLMYAQMVMNAYPQYTIKRLTSAEEKGLSNDNPSGPNYKYLFRCLGCGAEIGFVRSCPFVKSPSSYTCRKCGGHFVTQNDYLKLDAAQRSELNKLSGLYAPKPVPAAEKKRILMK